MKVVDRFKIETSKIQQNLQGKDKEICYSRDLHYFINVIRHHTVICD